MTPAVSDAVREIAATPRLLVALDFDGTLAALGDDPMAVRADPAAARAVARLAALPGTTVAFVSGRQIADLRIIAEHRDDSPVWLAGSHGAEWWRPGDADQDTGADAAARSDVSHVANADGAEHLIHEARAAIEGIQGSWIEPKPFGFALHTRLSTRDLATVAQRDVDDLVRSLAPSWRRRTGKDVLEYSWRHEGKDGALQRLRELTGATAVLFAGDDVTDEDAQRSLGVADLGVRVGDGDTAARIRVADPKELAALLDELVGVRAAL